MAPTTATFPPFGLPSDSRALVRAVLGGVLWGVFFSTAPLLHALMVGGVVWVPFLVWREARRLKRGGSLALLAVRGAVVAAVVAAAAWAPLKYEDQVIVGPFNQAPMELANLSDELMQKHRVAVHVAPDQARLRVSLPAGPMTLRELFADVEKQTGARASFGYCGNAPRTILWGGGAPMGIHLRG